MKEKSKLHVISFGNTIGYKNLSKDIILKIKKGYPSSTFKIYDQFDLPIEIRNICDTYFRGYGY